MSLIDKERLMRRTSLILLLIGLASSGCSFLMPPQKIPMDRRNYLDAVSTSWKEQLLNNLVKLRYGDTLTFLEITGINTNYSIDANLSAGYPVNWHPLLGTASFRNTVTTGGYVTYQDHPNITYNPIRGDQLAKTLNTPISVAAILRSLQTGWRADFIFSCCVESINGLRNRSASGAFEGDPSFFKFAQLFRDLNLNGVIRISIEQVEESIEKGKPEDRAGKITQDRGTIVSASINVDEDRARRTKLEKKLNQFYDLLEIKHGSELDVIDGNRQSIRYIKNGSKIVIQTRSIMELLNMLSNFIEVPSNHTEEHRAMLGKLREEPLNCNRYNTSERNQNDFIEYNRRLKFQILSDTHKPPQNDTFVAVKYRDHWFYIKDTDVSTKIIFSDTVGIFSMSEPGGKGEAPVLTLPVQ
jgi:hypothetical protein